MPTGGLLALLDDITSILDDVSTMTQTAAGKTAGVLGDDLALNAQQVADVRADRELPVVWAVAKGSALNKAILVPSALAISALAPFLIPPLLMAGGVYLCFEGVEKLAHAALHRGEHGNSHDNVRRAPETISTWLDPANAERARIKSAIRTDFVLSAEIVTITLGTVATAPLATRVCVLVLIAMIMTVGVYGLVAGIVRLDDMGRFLARRPGEGVFFRLERWLGRTVAGATPYLMRTLSVVGTAAMFLVGGGILVHGMPGAHDLVEHYVTEPAASVPGAGPLLAWLAPLLANAAAGIAAGAAALTLVSVIRWSARALSRQPV